MQTGQQGYKCVSIPLENGKTYKIKRSKYGNKKITFNGMTFDSQKEFNRYGELMLLQRAGRIKDLQRQVPYVIIPPQKDGRGRVIFRETKYIADFVYFDRDRNRWVVEDVKGVKTEVYRIKKKLMYLQHGLLVEEV